MKRFMNAFAVRTAVVALAVIAAVPVLAENRLYIEDFTIAPGETKTVDVILKNDVNIYGFQFEMIIPDGVELVADEYDFLANPGEKNPTYEVECSYWEKGGCYDVVSNDNRNRPIASGSGSVVSLIFKAKDDFKQVAKIKLFEIQIISSTSGTTIDLDEEYTTITPALPLATINAEGEEGKEYLVAEKLTVVEKIDGLNYIIATDGAGNWIRIDAGDNYNTMAAMKAFQPATFSGTLSKTNGNTMLTATKAPIASDEPAEVTIRSFDLVTTFHPQVNEVITLIGYYYGTCFRAYYGAHGQNADLNLAWSSNNPTLNIGGHYQIDRAVVQLHSAWEAEDDAAPAPRRMKESDNLAFQNYEIFPLAMPNNPTTAITEVTVDDNAAEQWIDLSGRTLNERPAAAGIYIKVAAGKAQKVVVK